jgi:hypothetical protein
MKKGIVVELTKSTAIIISNKCDFVKLKRKPYMYVSSEVEYNLMDLVDNYKRIKRIGYLAASFLLLFSVLFIMNKQNVKKQVYAYVNIDANLTIEIKVDKHDKVMNVYTINGSNKILSSINVSNNYMEKALPEIVKELKNEGYIKNDKKTLLLSSYIYNSNIDKTKKLLKTYDNYIHKKNKELEVFLIPGTKKDYEYSKDNKISISKSVIYSEFKNNGLESKYYELNRGSLEELILEYKILVNNNKNNSPSKLKDNTPSPNDVKRPNINGIEIFPSDSPWNIKASSFIKHEKSDIYISTIGGESVLDPNFGSKQDGLGIPINVVDSTAELVNVEINNISDSSKGPFPIPQNPLIQKNNEHMIIVQKGLNFLYEFYDVKRMNNKWITDDVIKWDLTKNQVLPEGKSSACGSGFPILPGLVRWDEVYEKGEINHTLAIRIGKIQNTFIRPASKSSNTTENNPSYIPMGSRFRLKQNFDISNFSKEMQVILKALKDYGAYVIGNGDYMELQGTYDERWNNSILRQLRKVKVSDFEVLYTGEPILYK